MIQVPSRVGCSLHFSIIVVYVYVVLFIPILYSKHGAIFY